MIKWSITDVISIVTTVQLFLLAVVLVSFKSGNRMGNRILSAFMLSNALLFIQCLIVQFIRIQWFPNFYLLLGPLLYLYIQSLCREPFSLRRRLILHFMPFLLTFLYLVVRVYFKLESVFGVAPVQWGFYETLILKWILHVQILCYLIGSLRTLWIYRSEIKTQYSNVENINLSWLVWLVFGFTMMWFCDATNTVLWYVKSVSWKVHFGLLMGSFAINFLFATAIAYKGLTQPKILLGIKEKTKYASSPLTQSDIDRTVKKLNHFMKTQKSYLTPSLSLNELAEKMSISPRYLSQVINEGLGQNFYDFVNHHRIEEFKRIFAASSDPRKTILEVLYEVGFNSKSAFNLVFKRYTGMTPKEFKKNTQLKKTAAGSLVFNPSNSYRTKKIEP